MLFREINGLWARLNIHEKCLQVITHVRLSVRRQLNIRYKERHTYVTTKTQYLTMHNT
jgi:hypothetical protein